MRCFSLLLLLTCAALVASTPAFAGPMFKGLGYLPGKRMGSYASGISADGSVVVGTSYRGAEAFRWTEADGMVGLGHLPGEGAASSALGVSADGSVIVGTARPPRERRPSVGRKQTAWSAWVIFLGEAITSVRQISRRTRR
jgi:probable HAF family extracellular repeat protein